MSSDIPKVRITFVRWQVECDGCGVLDSGIGSRADAMDLKRKHQQGHINANRKESNRAD